MNSISDLADCNEIKKPLSAWSRRASLQVLSLGLIQVVARPFGAGRAWAAGLPDWLLEAEGMVFIDRLIGQTGLPPHWVLDQLRGIERQDKALALVNPPADAPVIPRSLSRVLSRNLDTRTVRDGRAFMKAHQRALRQAEDIYGVPGAVIAGILGVETRFGRFKGSYPAIDTLASLALLSERRQQFFQQELAALLSLGYQRGLDLSRIQSSFAGALGIPQFMPSSWQRWAVDFDRDGQVNLLESPVDAIGSVANFLSEHGWQAGLPSHRPMRSHPQASGHHQRAFVVVGLEAKHTVAQLSAAGLIPKGLELAPQTPASLIELPEPDQPPTTWLVTNNFFSVTKYNRSYLYAASVLSLAEAIASPA